MRITGVSDHAVAYHDPSGLPLDALMEHTSAKGSLAGFSDQCTIAPDELDTSKNLAVSARM